jgi:uncharacterized membrane protein YkvA (DUF1232 family)
MIPLRNRFFDLAMGQAAKIAGKPARILALIAQLTLKLKKTDLNSINGFILKEKFLLLGRLLKAHVTGQYQIQSFRIVLILLAAIIYLVNPLDLIPDFIFGMGLVDDLAVVTWVFQAISTEVNAFARWEKEQACSATFSSL